MLLLRGVFWVVPVGLNVSALKDVGYSVNGSGFASSVPESFLYCILCVAFKDSTASSPFGLSIRKLAASKSASRVKINYTRLEEFPTIWLDFWPLNFI